MSYPTHYDRYFQVFALEFFLETLPWQWFKAQAIAESALDPQAVSPRGAQGLMQLMPGTAADMARQLGIKPHANMPNLNIRMGIAYDRRCWDIWQDEHARERIRFMLGSYNAGPGHIIAAQTLAAEAGLATDHWSSIVACLPAITGNKAIETITYIDKVQRLFTELIGDRA